MKIILSRTQWEEMGKSAGWMKASESTVAPPQRKSEYPKECQECHGAKSIRTKLKNLGTLEYVEHIISCPSCDGKGYVTQKDHDRYMHSMGLAPHPEDK